ncbi:MAG: hypothetical protein PHQ23_12560, partial [Candidatus Wallbacteria bacterium]|nr:hypothetical protein [Candidatus Wallbacteria bacterium]
MSPVFSPFKYSYLNARVHARRQRFFNRQVLAGWLETSFRDLYTKYTSLSGLHDEHAGLPLLMREFAWEHYLDRCRVAAMSPADARDLAEIYIFQGVLPDIRTCLRIEKGAFGESGTGLIADPQLREKASRDINECFQDHVFSRLRMFRTLLPERAKHSLLELERAL